MKWEGKTVSEQAFEEKVESELNSLGWVSKKDFPRKDLREVFDFDLLKEKIITINKVSDSISNLALNEIKKISDDLIDMNIKAHQMLINGIKIYNPDEERFITVKIVSNVPFENDFNLVRQFEVSNGDSVRIPDITLFINGIPIAVMELKGPLALEGVNDAFDQNESLKRHSPKLFSFNVLNFVSNDLITKYGSLTSSFKHFYGWNNWKTKEGKTPVEFLFNKEMIIKLINLYTFYSTEQNPVKYLAAPHQIRAVEATIEKLKKANDTRGGVVWHTQGSGKSVTMVFLTKAIITTFNKATVLLVTDRNTLDKQLYQRFLNAEGYLRTKADLIESRKDLVSKLDSKKHFGIYFSTVQKFTEETGVLSNRDDIFMLVDEAHRTQNNIDGERVLSKETEEIALKFGYARFMRDAFPNAKITGFTGTPLMKYDSDTRAIFGEYNDVYSMNDAVSDGATVPINYEMRKIKFELNSDYLREMDAIQSEYLKSLDGDDISSQAKIEALLKSVKITAVLEDDDVIKAKVHDMINHLSIRKKILHGKAMIVANSRNAAYKYYKVITDEFPEYKDKTILVMTESNKDSEEMQKAIVKRTNIDEVASEFRKSNSKYKIAIVVDMWLTGFDVPDLDVMYMDKIIKWHNLMQAIARVNRTYADKVVSKESGLIVDYIGIWKYLSDALVQYASGSTGSMDIEIEDVRKGREKLNEAFDLLDDFYIKGIKQFDLLSSSEKYSFVMSSYNDVLSFNLQKKNEFIKLARKIKRFFKIAYSIISDKEATISKGVEIINSLLTAASVQQDDQLILTIEAIKQAVEKAVDTKTTDVEVMSSKLTKDINQVAYILQEEADTLIKTSPKVAIQLLKSSLQAQLKELERVRPVFAKKASDKLRDIINELEKTDDIERTIEIIRELSKEIVNEKNKPLEFDEPQLQAFFEIISNDAYLSHNNNSEVLRKIATELMSVVKENITDQFKNNPKVRTKVLVELKKLLKTKYNYPPEQLGGTSGILVDLISKEIKINEGYFRKDD